MIAAMDRNRLIGKNNALPWHIPADYEYFKNTVRNYSVIMGRLSYEAEDAFLTEKKNLILSRQNSLNLASNCALVNSLEEAFEILKNEEEIFILGGAKVYEMALPHAQRLYITHIEAEFEGDAYFPEIDPAIWQLVWENKCNPDEKNPYPYVFTRYERVFL